MKVRFTAEAGRQVSEAINYIAERSPQGANRIRDRLAGLIIVLESQPFMGRTTDRRGVLRVTLTPFPYLVDYRVTRKEIIVMRFRHGSRR